MAEYGALAHPLPEGKPPSSTANNIAYRRDALLAHGQDLDALLEMDYFLQKAMKDTFRIVTAPRALVAHETNRYPRDLIRGHFLFAQLFANRRLQHEQWSVLKRLAVTPLVPVVVPLLRLKRLFQAVAGRPQLRDTAAGLPVILALYVSGALGEAWGLLRGGRLSAGNMVWFELEAERIAK